MGVTGDGRNNSGKSNKSWEKQTLGGVKEDGRNR
jgi:hypothetical protein